MNESWTRGERLAALALLVAVLSGIAGFLVVPEIREMLKLERDAKNENANAVASKAADVPAPVLATSTHDALSVGLPHPATSSRGTNADANQPGSSQKLPADAEPAGPVASDRGTEKLSGAGAKHLGMVSPPAVGPDLVAHLAEEDAGPGIVHGHVAVCTFGIAPDQRQGSTYSMDRSPICVRTETKVVRLQLDKTVLNEPPVFYQGKQYALRQLHVGDEIAAEVVAGAEMAEPILARIQLIKRGKQ
ncbi:MAG: hypothetical protein ABI779_18635 [Acidobacteriota bacterium]